MNTPPLSVRRRRATTAPRASAVTFAGLLALFALDLGCVETECDEGKTRDCACSQPCSYQECGQCVYYTIGWGPGTAVCSSSGTWGECPCQQELQPECDTCGEQCSAFLRSLVDQLPTPSDEAACRARFVDVRECAGGGCFGAEVYDGTCSAELEALDQACLGETHDCAPF